MSTSLYAGIVRQDVARTVCVINLGPAPPAVAIAGGAGRNVSDVAEHSTCARTISYPGCTSSATSTPLAISLYTISMGIRDNASHSPQTVPLGGDGLLPIV
jgi:hypothetical protein